MIYILCRQNEDDTLTGIALDLSEAAAKSLAEDGDYVVIPIQIGKVYDDIINAGIVGTVTFENTSLGTLINQAKNAINNIQDDITTLQNQVSAGNTAIQNLNALVQDLDDRVTALEGG